MFIFVVFGLLIQFFGAVSSSDQASTYYYSVDFNYYASSQKYCFSRFSPPKIITTVRPGLDSDCLKLPQGFTIGGKNFINSITCFKDYDDHAFLRLKTCNSNCSSCSFNFLTAERASGENFCSFYDDEDNTLIMNYNCNQCNCNYCNKSMDVYSTNIIPLKCELGKKLMIRKFGATRADSSSSFLVWVTDFVGYLNYTKKIDYKIYPNLSVKSTGDRLEDGVDCFQSLLKEDQSIIGNEAYLFFQCTNALFSCPLKYSVDWYCK